MLHCRACLSRCIRALDTPPLQAHRLRRDRLPALTRSQRRSASSSTRDHRPAERYPRVDRPPPQKRDPWERSGAARKQKMREGWALRRPVDREAMKKELSAGEMWLGRRDPRVPLKEWNRRKRELQFLRDPIEVASFVQQELAKGKAKEMLQLVRMASHSMQIVVSWNHIIDHLMKKSSVTAAMKVYNEMKKRGQFPDSYTYTIILRGLSSNADKPDAARNAIAVYHSMTAPNSKVQPSIIHTNAALNVCARALDMDALWGFAAMIPESGPGAADPTTFTIILNAIRQHLLVDAPPGEGEVEKARRRDRGVVEGRRIWEDVVRKWRNADILIEEELVCAMGRLLLVGSRPRDWDDVLSLVEQTMDIPRLVPRLGTIARNALPRLRTPNTPPEFKFDDDHLKPDKDYVRGDEFLAITSEGKGDRKPRPLTYATPSNETLAIVLEACAKIAAHKAADEYWNTLTDPGTYAIIPDSVNLHHRLRLLRVNRGSNAAVKLLREDFVANNLQLKPGTFRIAMSTCVRDKNNHNSLQNASQILHLMMDTLPDADAKTSLKYAQLVVTAPLAKGKDLVEALTYLQPVVKSLKIQLDVGTERTYGGRSVARSEELSPEAREDVIAALRKVYAIYDRLLNSNMIAEERKGPFKADRARLSATLHRIMFKANEKSRPNESRPREGAASEDALYSPDGLGDNALQNRTEAESLARGWRAQRAQRAVPPEQRKTWSSPSTEQRATS